MIDPLFIGLLSGTSMDAIDAAIVHFKKDKPILLHALNHPIPKAFKLSCLEIMQSDQGSIDDYGHLDALAGELFAEAAIALLKKSHIDRNQIKAIGSHGQSIRHRPNSKPPFTLQIGDPNIISERTGILTIADFRRRDIAAGGQGAPLAPAFHAALFASEEENRIVVNIGGIANISFLPKRNNSALLGFDSGPGNCLMDLWMKENWQIPFDNEGSHAKKGKISNTLLDCCLADPYFSQTPPKSTGREYFNLRWLNKKIESIQETLSPIDIQATLLALTAKSIAKAIQSLTLDVSIFVSGGGAHNLYLIQSLNKLLDTQILSTETLGYPPDWIEALLFAWLAKQTLEGKSGNCPSVTGARHAIPLGGIFGFSPKVILGS